MSTENITALRSGLAHLEREGVPDFELFDPDVEIINFDSFPISRPYRGWDGVVAWLVDVSEPFDGFRMELVEVLAYDADNVVTSCRIEGDSTAGGPAFELTWGVVWSFRDGRAVRVEGFRTPDEALESAGLSP